MSKGKTQSLKLNANDQGKNTELKIECTLIGGVLPMFELYYQNRKITGFFNRSIWNDKKAILKMAENVIETRNKVQPFNYAK